MVPAFVENAFIKAVLKHALDGNKGSNILGAIILALTALDVNWAKAIAGVHMQDTDSALELAKVVSAVIAAVFAYFVGKNRAAEPGPPVATKGEGV